MITADVVVTVVEAQEEGLAMVSFGVGIAIVERVEKVMAQAIGIPAMKTVGTEVRRGVNPLYGRR